MKLRNALMGLGTVVLAMGFNSCDISNDSDFQCPEDFTGALLENENGLVGKWELTGIMADKEVDLTSDGEDNPTKDIYAQYSECEKDTDFVFSSNRGYTNSQGQNADNCTNKVTFSGTWRLTNQALSLVRDCSMENLPLEFNEEKSTFSYKGDYTVTDVHGMKIRTEVTFTYSKAPNDLESAK
ncbi:MULTISPECIES: DUF5004 domain-containing protein [Arenibacter]|uniref:DUF5004 domain-containing protein n=1 Tax=Arenibacter TaxID=178469 RepID=UPI001593F34A|nr:MULTISPECIES: DUF5004 domain-containing protein [Arenibacter]